MNRFIPEDERILPLSFFDRVAPLVARELLGKVLVSTAEGAEAGGAIVEAEAYLGPEDPGSHAATRAVTARNQVMYAPPGTVYVYFTYGNHHMINLVCGSEGTPSAVLVRALEPTLGIDVMTARRHGRAVVDLCNGPGKLAQALGIDLTDNGRLLGEGRLVVYDSPRVSDADVAVSGRIGLSAGHDLDLRFYLRGNRFVSKGRTGLSSRHGTPPRKDPL